MSKKYEDNSKILKISEEEYLKKKEAVTSFFSDKAYVKMTFKQIANILNVNKNQIHILDSILTDLENEGIIYIDDSKRYDLTKKLGLLKCTYSKKNERYGFGINIENEEDIYIQKENSLYAMNNDEVLVEKLTNNTGKLVEGKVVKILKRNNEKVVGTFVKNKNFGFVIPIDTKIDDIYISKKNSVNIKDSALVEVKIEKYPSKNSKSEGKIIRVIGNINDKNVDVKALYISYGLDKLEKFNKNIENELKNIPDKVLKIEMEKREDRTLDNIFTIDSEDAMDLDDAVSVKKLGNGNYLLSVYIADVSHYVKESSYLDKEAISRGTSIYIPGQVIPMLPKKLSNGICSLNAKVLRLALGCDMEIDKKGNVLSSNVFKAVIKVAKKMTYDNVYKTLENDTKNIDKEYIKYKKDLVLMKELALILMKKRKNDGCIDFDIKETKIVLDKMGDVVDIKPYEITIANKIIEEFMLVTNMTIAEKFFFLDVPFIYRIHEKPDEEKLIKLNELLSSYKKRIKGIKNVHPSALSNILKGIENEEEKEVISTYMLRTLKIARYSNICSGHFGLSAKYYCHFTSPIRRYPDLFIHRIISNLIDNNYLLNDKNYLKYEKKAEIYSKTSSDMEKKATLIERDFNDLYIVKYMEKFLGNIYEGIVSSVTSFGMFVKLENTAEGLVPFKNMPDDDYYIYDERKSILIGEKTSKTYKIGDKVKVKLQRADTKLKEIDFLLL